MNYNSENMNKVLRIIRIACDYSIKEAAIMAEITPSYLSMIECGSRPVTDKIVRKVAEVYGLTDEQIIELTKTYNMHNGSEREKHILALSEVVAMLLHAEKNGTCF